MDKLKFEFTMKSSVDGKSNIICITSIETPDNRVFNMPTQFQPAYLHTELTNLPAFSKIKNSLLKRHQIRRIWINLTQEIAREYLDEEDNVQFKEYFLEEITEPNNLPSATAGTSEEPLVKILEKMVELQQRKDNISTTKLAEHFRIEKFTNKNSNAHQWITEFETECERLEIVHDEKKIEILKLFLEKSCIDWYQSMVIKHSLEAEWNRWKKGFIESFANKGWSLTRYALAFRYQTGTLMEYAMKKERLLLEVRKDIDTGTLIDLIAAGLPNFVADMIDRDTLKETEDLYNDIGKLEHLVYKKTLDGKKLKNYNKDKDYNIKEKIEKKPCSICEKKSKGVRYHPETTCWFKTNDNKIKNINNTVLEVELNSQDPKNL